MASSEPKKDATPSQEADKVKEPETPITDINTNTEQPGPPAEGHKESERADLDAIETNTKGAPSQVEPKAAGPVDGGVGNEKTTDNVNRQEFPDDEDCYIPPLADPLDKASKYLSKHDIFGLLQGITAGIAYKRPTEPLQFMIDQIEKIQEQERRRKGVITRKPSAKS